MVFVHLEIVVGARSVFDQWIELDSDSLDTFSDVLHSNLPDAHEYLRDTNNGYVQISNGPKSTYQDVSRGLGMCAGRFLTAIKHDGGFVKICIADVVTTDKSHQ